MGRLWIIVHIYLSSKTWFTDQEQSSRYKPLQTRKQPRSQPSPDSPSRILSYSHPKAPFICIERASMCLLNRPWFVTWPQRERSLRSSLARRRTQNCMQTSLYPRTPACTLTHSFTLHTHTHKRLLAPSPLLPSTEIWAWDHSWRRDITWQAIAINSLVFSFSFWPHVRQCIALTNRRSNWWWGQTITTQRLALCFSVSKICFLLRIVGLFNWFSDICYWRCPLLTLFWFV